MRASTNPRRLPAGCLMTAIALGLAACGGGDDDLAPPAASTPSVSGIVIDGPIKGATVCFDMNGNGSCDDGEPSSGPTDETGGYTIPGFSDADLAEAPCIAMVPADALDMDDPSSAVGTAFQMTAPAGKCAVISPITTLVQTAVSDGMTLADAQAAVARQLVLADPSSVFLNYVGSPEAADSASLSVWAGDTIVPMLMAGIAPTTKQQSLTTQRIDEFRYTDANNYYLRWFEGTGSLDSDGQVTFTDQRRELVGGVWRPITELYDTALALTESGQWVRCDETMSHKSTVGSPTMSNYCAGDYATQATATEDVSGQAIADIVRRAQAADLSSLPGVDPDALPVASFPDGAEIQVRVTGYGLTYNIRYRESDGSVPSVATLEQLIAAFPVPASPEHANTVAASALFDSPWKRYRVAFGPDGFARFYLCDVQQNLFTFNCRDAGSGAYEVKTVGGTRVMTFSGNPSESNSALVSNRVFVERNDLVYYGFQSKPGSFGGKIRLNSVAFEALASALGIVPPWQQPQ